MTRQSTIRSPHTSSVRAGNCVGLVRSPKPDARSMSCGPMWRFLTAGCRELPGTFSLRPYANGTLRSLCSPRAHRKTTVIGHGLARFARGSFDQPIPPVGPPELTQVAQSANEKARALEREQRAQRELVACVAHDLVHPLTAMRGTLEALRD